jgi:signal transduction histidine kinase
MLSVFLTLITTALIELVIGFALLQVGVFENIDSNPAFYIAIMFIVGSVIIGLSLAFAYSLFIVKPANTLLNGIEDLADGKYETRLNLGKNQMVKTLNESFNKLAGELQNTAMLRSDFTNNFSHEFKTPIVSIYGFAKILNNGNVPPEKQAEYLGIIETEAERLATMATNILNLTRVENQNIISNKSRFNLSEQIRKCVLLIEKKWTNKKLTPELDFDEFYINADKELLKQVWINLLDNAVKFAKVGTNFEIDIRSEDKTISVSITNYGKEIPADQIKKIYDKFYQTDKSRSIEGNGIGLSIVKRVVTLHNGTVQAVSENGKTTFTVTLPIR